MSMVPPTGGEKSAGFTYNEKLETDGEHMPEVTLRAIVEEEIRSSIGFVGGDISEQRRRAMDYYMGDPFGNEQEDRSQVISTDVQDTIESIMPDFLEIFAGGDDVVRFEPVSEEDEPFAKQATEYCNFIWNKDNNGFGVSHDWIKDALLQKNGIIKVYWEEQEEQKTETLEGLNSLQMQELEEDDEVEITAHEEYQIDDPVILAVVPDGVLHDVQLTRTVTEGYVRIMPVPPEEFLIARRAIDLHDNFAFACHKVRKTASDLIQMGYDPELIDQIPSHDEQDYNEERVSRFDDDEWPELDDSLDPAMREIWLYECYLKVDFDGDGVAELRQVTVAGPGYQVLENEAIDDHPFAAITPIRMPHKFFGRSVADLVMDVQLIKSTVQRQLLDNMYGVNNNRAALSNKVDIDDFLTKRPDGVVRVDVDTPEVQGHIAPIVTPPLGNWAYPLLEYWDGVREGRTGVTRLNQGLDPDALNKTARGMNMLLGRTQRRMLLMARIFAETGYACAFKKMLALVINRQQRARMIRLRNEWVPMDPRSWNAKMDVTVSVGLGYGTKETQAALLERLLEKQALVVQFQGGAEGPLITLENIHNTFEAWIHAQGIKDADKHITDPQGMPQQRQDRQPDPKLIEAQMKAQNEQAKLQLEAQKFQAEQATESEKLRLEWAKLEMEHNIDVEKLGVEREQIAGQLIKNEQDAALRAQESEDNLAMKERESEGKAATDVAKALSDSAKTLSQAASNGNGADGLKQASDQLMKVAAMLNAPKRVVRGKKGEITGVETITE